MTRATPERSAQIAVLRWARMVLPAGSIVALIENERQARSGDKFAAARFGMARKASGVVTGIPDLVCIMPGGCVAWIEMKAPGAGVLSEAQQAVHQQMHAIGHTVIVATGIETARHGLQAAGIALREAAGQSVARPVVRRAKSRLRADRIPF